MILENNIPAASLGLRNLEWNKLPNWFFEISKGDYGLVILLAEKGKGKYFNVSMSVYRLHDGGVWSVNKVPYFIEENLKFYNMLFRYFKNKNILQAIKIKKNRVYQDLGLLLIREGFLYKGIIKIISNYNLTFDKKCKVNFRNIASSIKVNLLNYRKDQG